MLNVPRYNISVGSDPRNQILMYLRLSWDERMCCLLTSKAVVECPLPTVGAVSCSRDPLLTTSPDSVRCQWAGLVSWPKGIHPRHLLSKPPCPGLSQTRPVYAALHISKVLSGPSPCSKILASKCWHSTSPNLYLMDLKLIRKIYWYTGIVNRLRLTNLWMSTSYWLFFSNSGNICLGTRKLPIAGEHQFYTHPE